MYLASINTHVPPKFVMRRICISKLFFKNPVEKFWLVFGGNQTGNQLSAVFLTLLVRDGPKETSTQISMFSGVAQYLTTYTLLSSAEDKCPLVPLLIFFYHGLMLAILVIETRLFFSFLTVDPIITRRTRLICHLMVAIQRVIHWILDLVTYGHTHTSLCMLQSLDKSTDSSCVYL